MQQVGGLACGVRRNTRILKEYGPPLAEFHGEVVLLDAGFPYGNMVPS